MEYTIIFPRVSICRSYWAEHIADAIMDIFDNWQLSTDELVAATTDSGSKIYSTPSIFCELAVLVIILIW